MILQRNAEEREREREGGGHELGQFAQTMAQSAEAAATAMHLVECWETREKMEENEREREKRGRRRANDEND